jgi:hypothetical protein
VLNHPLVLFMKNISSQSQAFTRADLAAAVATVGLLTVLVVHGQDLLAAKARADRIRCVNNLKQIGLQFRMWSNDHNDKFPMQREAKDGGSIDAIASGETFRHFLACSNQWSSPKLLICPSDTRTAAADLATVANRNLSYFVALDADEAKPQMLLSGDRNLTNGLPTQKAVLEIPADRPSGWTGAMHVEAGNLGLADGSALQTSNASLRMQIKAHLVKGQPVAQRLQFPD